MRLPFCQHIDAFAFYREPAPVFRLFFTRNCPIPEVLVAAAVHAEENHLAGVQILPGQAPEIRDVVDVVEVHLLQMCAAINCCNEPNLYPEVCPSLSLDRPFWP